MAGASGLPWNQWLGGISQALGAIPQGLLGTHQYYKSKRALKQLEDQGPVEYSIAPEQQKAYDESYKMSKMGYTPQEKTSWKQNIAQSNNTAYRQGLNMAGGNMAQALSAGLASQNIGAVNQFAGQDAALNRQNISSWQRQAGAMQNQRNLMDQLKIADNREMKRAYGMAMQRGLQNMASASSTALSSYSGSVGNSSNAFTNSGMGGDPSQTQKQQGGNTVEQDFQQGGDFYGSQMPDYSEGSKSGNEKFWGGLYKQNQPSQYGSTYGY